MDENSKRIDLLNERYKTLRQEILMRIDYKYKLFNSSLLALSIGIGVIWKLKWFGVGYLLCGFLALVTALILAESRQIIMLSDYLIKIEDYLDNTLDMPIEGWEKHTRLSYYKSINGTNHIVIFLLITFLLSYLTFSYIAISNTDFIFIKTFVGEKYQLWGTIGTCLLLSIPLFVLLQYVVGSSSKYWKEPEK